MKFGNFVSIAGGVCFHTACNHPSIRNRKVVSNFPFKEIMELDYAESAYGKGPIIVKNDVWIAEGARVLDNVTIGNGAIIAASAVVTKDVPDYAMVAGNPAVVKKYRFTPRQIKKLLEICWWDWSDEDIAKNIGYFNDINLFIKKFG